MAPGDHRLVSRENLIRDLALCAGRLLMVRVYFDRDEVSVHDEFQAWRTEHQNGVFLSLKSRTRAKLHGARCQHLGSGPPYFTLSDGFGSLTKKQKVCGSEAELSAWAKKKGVTVVACQHCLRDKLCRNSSVQAGVDNIRLPEEIAEDAVFTEGSAQRILVNRYERDPRARKKCIQHYGTTCFVCGFDFVAVYGDIMSGFIHVHHLNALSSIGTDYEVDPIQDLRPVCPNCHAVVHRRAPPYSLKEVRHFLKDNESRH